MLWSAYLATFQILRYFLAIEQMNVKEEGDSRNFIFNSSLKKNIYLLYIDRIRQLIMETVEEYKVFGEIDNMLNMKYMDYSRRFCK